MVQVILLESHRCVYIGRASPALVTSPVKTGAFHVDQAYLTQVLYTISRLFPAQPFFYSANCSDISRYFTGNIAESRSNNNKSYCPCATDEIKKQKLTY